MPDVIEAETGAFTPEVVEGLRAMGHTVEVPGEAAGNSRRSSHVWGNLQTVAWDLSTNTLSGGTDPRRSAERRVGQECVRYVQTSVVAAPLHNLSEPASTTVVSNRQKKHR